MSVYVYLKTSVYIVPIKVLLKYTRLSTLNEANALSRALTKGPSHRENLLLIVLFKSRTPIIISIACSWCNCVHCHDYL